MNLMVGPHTKNGSGLYSQGGLAKDPSWQKETWLAKNQLSWLSLVRIKLTWHEAQHVAQG